MTTPLGPPTGTNQFTELTPEANKPGPALTHEQALPILLDLLRKLDQGKPDLLAPCSVDLTTLPLPVLLAMDEDYREAIRGAERALDLGRAESLFLRRLGVGREIARRRAVANGLAPPLRCPDLPFNPDL